MQPLYSGRLFHLLADPELFLHLPRPRGGAPLPGDHRRGVPPVPIPNTAVKPSAANGSRTIGPARVGRCRVMARALRTGASGLSVFPVSATPPKPRGNSTRRLRSSVGAPFARVGADAAARVVNNFSPRASHSRNVRVTDAHCELWALDLLVGADFARTQHEIGTS